jgi:Uma2 family endonuclease
MFPPNTLEANVATLEDTPPVRMSPQEFETFILLPENIDQHYELIAGKVYEMVSHGPSSVLGGKFLYYVLGFVMQHNLGVVTGADGGYRVGGNRCIPHVGFTRKERATGEMTKGYYNYAPDLAIEIISPTDKPKKILQKITGYLNAGVTVWLVDPEDRTIGVYAPQKPFIELGENDTLDGGEILAGFTLEVKRLFE